MTGLAPLHWWRFHEADVGAEDDVGSDPDSPITTKSGSVSSQQAGPLEAGETTYSAQFASGGYLQRTNLSSNDFAGLTDGSITVFFKASTSSTTQFMFGAHPDNRNFAVYMLSDGSIFHQIIEGSTVRGFITDVTGLDDSAWHLLAITCDGSNPNRIYIDGSEVTYSYSGTTLPNYSWLTTASYGGSFRIGQDSRYPTTGYDFPYTGYLSELAFFSYALSATDVYNLWAASQPESPVTPGTGGHRYKGRRTFVGF